MARRSRHVGWLGVAFVSVAANLAWFSAGRKFPNSPVGQLNRRIIKGQ